MKDFLLSLKKNLQKNNQVIVHVIKRLNPAVAVFIIGVIIIGSLFTTQQIIEFKVTTLNPLENPFPIVKPAEYPELERKYIPQITAQAAYVLDETSKVVLLEKNSMLRFSPASTTKIMTALVALDYFKDSDILTIKRSNVEPVVVGFPIGTKVTFDQMLYAMLVPSGNDAAYAIADNYPGGITAFVDAMNKKAKLLHLENTHFADPVGLVDEEDYTTVHDLALLASIAMAHPVIAHVVDTKAITIHDLEGNLYQLKNTNLLLGQYGVNGIKTGYTDEAGEVLVTSTILNGHTYIIVVMKSDDRFADTQKLLDLLSENVTFLKLKP